MMEAEGDKPQEDATKHDPLHHPAREMSLHLLRMLETRLEAAGLVAQAESRRLLTRLQLRLLAVGALFIALWGGIVLLAIALPDRLRVPVLGAVVADLRDRRRGVAGDRGPHAGQPRSRIAGWFLEGLKMDLEVLARSLAQPVVQAAPPPEEKRSPPSDVAA
jgi:uncharacterized membrane protein YqjE